MYFLFQFMFLSISSIWTPNAWTSTTGARNATTSTNSTKTTIWRQLWQVTKGPGRNIQQGAKLFQFNLFLSNNHGDLSKLIGLSFFIDCPLIIKMAISSEPLTTTKTGSRGRMWSSRYYFFCLMPLVFTVGKLYHFWWWTVGELIWQYGII